MSTGGFGGSATLERSDVKRLNTQLDTVRQIMSDGRYRTLEQIARIVKELSGKKATEASVSARLRDLRKDKFGGYNVERRNIGNGLFEYAVFAADGKGPAKPISFNVKGTKSGVTNSQTPPKPLAGGRAASSYVDELNKNKK